MKYVVDTSLINKLVDGYVHVDELPKDGPFIASHVQHDDLNRTKNSKRSEELLQKFSETIDEIVPTESFVLGISRLGEGKFGVGNSYNAIKREQDLFNGGKQN